jgi:hypothetical protein
MVTMFGDIKLLAFEKACIPSCPLSAEISFANHDSRAIALPMAVIIGCAAARATANHVLPGAAGTVDTASSASWAAVLEVSELPDRLRLTYKDSIPV